MSSVSRGLASGLWDDGCVWPPCPVKPVPVVDKSMEDLVRLGLGALSLELERFGGLRSSSERERFSGMG
jgi:hypothetical protein